MYRWIVTALALASSVLVPAAQGAGASEDDSGPCGSATTAPPAQFDHVVWIIYENKPWDLIFSSGDAPYITGLADQCGRGDNMHHLYPKSLANYIGLTSGTTGGINSDRSPSTWPQSQASIFEQLGTDWRELNESMPSNCLLKSSGDYSVNHAPAQYYTAIRSTCQQRSIPLGSTPDISARFTLIIPNKVHDMHRTPSTPSIPSRIRAGDQWTSQIVPELIASPEYQAGKTAIFLTWDEANSKTDRIPFVVVSPYTAPLTRSNTSFTHYSLLEGTEEMLGLPKLLGAADSGTTSIRAAFNLV
jgi:hypothetical protein